MSKSINLEIITIEDEYARLEDEDGSIIEIELKHLPSNLKEGRFLRFIISHTDYNPDRHEELIFGKTSKISPKDTTANGRQLTY